MISLITETFPESNRTYDIRSWVTWIRMRLGRDVEMTYEKVKSLAGWTVDKNVVLTITSYYVTSEREFDAESLSRCDGRD